MNQETVLIINFALCVLDAFMINRFFQSMFAKRTERAGFVPYLIFVWFSLCLINSFGNVLINFALIPVVFFIFVRLSYKISLRKAVIYTLIYYIVFGCGREMAFEMLYRLLNTVFPGEGGGLSASFGTAFLLAEYIFSLLFLLYITRYTRKIKMAEDNGDDVYLLIMPAASVLVLYIFVYMEFPEQRWMQLLMCGGGFLLYFSNAAVFVILARFAKNMNRIKLVELSLLKRDMEQSNFENIAKANDVYRKYMHDIHQYFNQFKSLARKGQNDLIVDIIDGWETNLSKEQNTNFYVSSPVLNSILTEYCDRAKGLGADISIFVEENLKVDFIQDVDKISLFGNLLDNALEAAISCREGNRKIRIRMFMGSRYILVFEVRNTRIGELRREKESLLSTKQDTGNHGLGIGIVRELAAKYGGELELEEQGEWFGATLMLSQPVD